MKIVSFLIVKYSYLEDRKTTKKKQQKHDNIQTNNGGNTESETKINITFNHDRLQEERKAQYKNKNNAGQKRNQKAIIIRLCFPFLNNMD